MRDERHLASRQIQISGATYNLFCFGLILCKLADPLHRWAAQAMGNMLHTKVPSCGAPSSAARAEAPLKEDIEEHQAGPHLRSPGARG